jgi:1-acyl-sn-glycerol-3-phosphate acyltransferase
MGMFKRGIGALVAATEVAVVPCHLAEAFAAFLSHYRVPRPRKLILTVGPPLRFPATPNDKDGWTAVAAAVEAEVRRLGGLPPLT